MCNIFNSETFTFFISSFITIVSWFAISYLTSEREKKNKQTEIKIKYLVDAYRDISIFITRENHKCITVEVHNNFERAIRDIQIYGSLDEIQLVNDYVMNINKKGYNIDPLLNKLKNNLRTTLNLEPNDTPTHWVMIPEVFNVYNVKN